MTTISDARIYADAYNAAIARGFESLGPEQLEETYSAGAAGMAEVRNLVLNTIQDWDASPLSSGKTARELLQHYAESAEFWSFIYELAHRIDGDFPDAVRIELGRRSQEGIEVLRTWVDDAVWDEDTRDGASESLQVAVTALRILGEWEDTGNFDAWIRRFAATETPAPIFSEAIVAYCAALPMTAIQILGSFLQAVVDEGAEVEDLTLQGREYLIVSLTEAAKALDEVREEDGGRLADYEERMQAIYLILRSLFLQHEPRVIAAICLGDLGHARAVPLLRNFIIRHQDEAEVLDRQLYYEIISSIKRLGGETKDLPDPFKDFSGRGGAPWPSR